jgi:hypothetical protein
MDLSGVRRAFESLVQVGHVGVVVLSMVDLHGQRVDMGLQRIVCVGQFWEGEGHGMVVRFGRSVDGTKIFMP